MALDPLNSSNLEQLALKGLNLLHKINIGLLTKSEALVAAG